MIRLLVETTSSNLTISCPMAAMPIRVSVDRLPQQLGSAPRDAGSRGARHAQHCVQPDIDLVHLHDDANPIILVCGREQIVYTVVVRESQTIQRRLQGGWVVGLARGVRGSEEAGE